MRDYIQITFPEILPEQQEWVIAHLSEAGYEGFEQEDQVLKAFIPGRNYDPELLKSLAFKYHLDFREDIIKEQNWNKVWEANFQPVVVDDLIQKTPWVGIRADFHAPITGVEHEIIITPKMSFGTGHHASTLMMMQQMRSIDMQGKSVLDFGTGTGILAILAEKMGASGIVAIDNDDWSIANAEENVRKNNCRNILLKKSDYVPGDQHFDVILANINKHVIVNNFPSLSRQLKPLGILILSGLLTEDEEDIMDLARSFPLDPGGKTTQANWLSIRFNH